MIVLGLTFKEDVPDLRNSKVIDVIRELQSYGAKVYVHDPVAENDEAVHEYGVSLTPWDELPEACAMVAAVAHRRVQGDGAREAHRQARAGRGVRRREGRVRSGRDARPTDSSVWRL